MSQYFPKPYELFGGDINVKPDLSNYASKTDLKNVSHVDVSSFALKSNLASLKTKVDKLDIDKLAPVPVDLSKLSDVVKNDVVNKTEYNKLVTKVDNIDTTRLVSKTKYENDGADLEKKISDVDKKVPDVSGLVKNTDFNSEITEVENKIPNVSDLITKTNFNAKVTVVENKILDVINLATTKKTDFDAKLKGISDRVTLNKSKHLLVENELKKLKTLDLS